MVIVESMWIVWLRNYYSLVTPIDIEHTQRHSLFKTQCTINKRVCEMIVDNGNCENILSKALVKILELTTMKHPHPYKVGLIKHRTELTVNEVYQVTFSIRKHYQDKVTCDVLKINVCHLLLGRPWQFDKEVIYKGKENVYLFTWQSKKIIITSTTIETND